MANGVAEADAAGLLMAKLLLKVSMNKKNLDDTKSVARSGLDCISAALLFFLCPGSALAQIDHSMHHNVAGMESASMMPALLGPYVHTREASGTAWEPDSTPMEGLHYSYEDWSFMVHGFATGIYDHQGGKRGDDEVFSSNMAMFMASHPLGDGTVGFKSMLSLEPLMGKNGYPLLLQTGETANGETELIDRQHPHDLFMELALSYSYNLSQHSSLFIYGGLPGEPALGPAAFMHRASGEEIPDAPITHHWLDSTHITEGVVTLGAVIYDVKLESSAFNGREPDQHRYNIETRSLDSYSYRGTYNFANDWSAQLSYGYLNSPEQLAPDVSVRRTSASVTYNTAFDENFWATTLAWGRNRNSPGDDLDGFLLESTFKFAGPHTIFSRYENVEKDELFEEDSPQADEVFRVNKLALGYIYDLPNLIPHFTIGIGGEGSWAILPSSLDEAYGDSPFSFLFFVRGKIV